jgi:hypothetical protein
MSNKIEGEIVFYSDTKQFGFIKPDGSEGDIFFTSRRTTATTIPLSVTALRFWSRMIRGVRAGGERRRLCHAKSEGPKRRL